MDEQDPREAPTPRVSGTLQRAPVYAAMAQALAERLGRAYLEKSKILARLDIKGAMRCRQLEKTARELEAEFKMWEYMDPGPDVRLNAVMRLRDLESEADQLAPLVPDRL